MSLAVLVPVLGRPHRVEPTKRAFEGVGRVLFIPDPTDKREILALRKAGAEFVAHCGGYASKIRRGIEETTEDLIFTAADDLAPEPEWLERAAAYLGPAQVVGVNDLLSRNREHATHFLMTREYAAQPTIDGAYGPFFEGYSHWYCDDELIATARKRGVYAYAPDSHVAHLHHINGAAPLDATYEKGRSRARQDRRLFIRRSRLWK